MKAHLLGVLVRSVQPARAQVLQQLRAQRGLALCHRVAHEFGSDLHHLAQVALDLQVATHVGIGQGADVPAGQATKVLGVVDPQAHRCVCRTRLPARPLQRQRA
ncbi:hypothetical protein FQZ97_681250 [compost metagenome]